MENSIIKIIIADDSGFMRLLVSDILSAYNTIEIIAKVSDGKEAYEKTCELKPDVVLLDLNMGSYDGLYATTKIMESCPTPIIILSASGNTDMKEVMKALEAGAFDFLNKPVNSGNFRNISEALVKKIETASRVNKSTLQIKQTTCNTDKHSFDSNLLYSVVVIGSSTGGPTAVEKVLTRLPENMPVPVLIAQHMPANFVHSFTKRLNELIPLNVVVGELNEYIKEGTVYIAPGDKNMIIKRNKHNGRVQIDFTNEKFKEFNNPSVDALMLSVADIYKSKCVGVILTGMGQDGLQGMKKINEANGYTIAQSKETCVVYGMPKAVVENKAAKSIVNIDEIGGFVVSCLS